MRASKARVGLKPGKRVTRAGAHTASRNEKTLAVHTQGGGGRSYGRAAEVVAPSSSIPNRWRLPVVQIMISAEASRV